MELQEQLDFFWKEQGVVKDHIRARIILCCVEQHASLVTSHAPHLADPAAFLTAVRQRWRDLQTLLAGLDPLPLVSSEPALLFMPHSTVAERLLEVAARVPGMPLALLLWDVPDCVSFPLEQLGRRRSGSNGGAPAGATALAANDSGTGDSGVRSKRPVSSRQFYDHIATHRLRTLLQEMLRCEAFASNRQACKARGVELLFRMKKAAQQREHFEDPLALWGYTSLKFAERAALIFHAFRHATLTLFSSTALARVFETVGRRRQESSSCFRVVSVGGGPANDLTGFALFWELYAPYVQDSVRSLAESGRVEAGTYAHGANGATLTVSEDGEKRSDGATLAHAAPSSSSGSENQQLSSGASPPLALQHQHAQQLAALRAKLGDASCLAAQTNLCDTRQPVPLELWNLDLYDGWRPIVSRVANAWANSGSGRLPAAFHFGACDVTRPLDCKTGCNELLVGLAGDTHVFIFSFVLFESGGWLAFLRALWGAAPGGCVFYFNDSSNRELKKLAESFPEWQEGISLWWVFGGAMVVKLPFV